MSLVATIRRRVVRRDRATSTVRPTAQVPTQELQRVLVECWPAPGVRGGDDW